MTLNNTISKAEQDVDAAEALTSQLRTIEADIDEKERRLQKIRDEFKAATYDERITEKSTQIRSLGLKNADLEKEIQSLSLQADTRARLDLKREALRTKTSEVKTMYVAFRTCFHWNLSLLWFSHSLEINNPKFRRFVSADAHAETMEREVERVLACVYLARYGEGGR